MRDGGGRTIQVRRPHVGGDDVDTKELVYQSFFVFFFFPDVIVLEFNEKQRTEDLR